MSGGTLNATKHLKRQGLDSTITYEAVVVGNMDPRFLGRITARIAGVFDGIPDDDLPWCISMYHHVDGSKGGGWDSNPSRSGSGTFMVPKVGHKIGVIFPTADPHRPVWTNYTIDEKGVLPETKVNYPDRAVFRFSNGSYMIIDTKTNEVLLNNPGDIDITILGDVNQTIVGNQSLTVTGTTGDIPSYLTSMPGSILSKLSPKPTRSIPFKGLQGGSSGNQHTRITGHQTTIVEGNRETIVKGNDVLKVGKNRMETIAMLHRVQAARSETNG